LQLGTSKVGEKGVGALGGQLAVDANSFVNSLELCVFSVGIGGPVTTVFCPVHSFPHASPAGMELRGVNERLVRLSVGFEDPADLLDDIGSALERTRST
jgi:cystathionine beta-lyase/cystathionine gamma-synthase